MMPTGTPSSFCSLLPNHQAMAENNFVLPGQDSTHFVATSSCGVIWGLCGIVQSRSCGFAEFITASGPPVQRPSAHSMFD